MNLKLGLFIKELAMFGLTFALGIYAAYRQAIFQSPGITERISFHWTDWVGALAFAVIFYFIIKKFTRFRSIVLNFFMAVLLLAGGQVVFTAFSQAEWIGVAVIFMVIIFFLVRNVLIHNLGMIIGLAGVSAMLGLAVQPQIVILILVIFSFYDILAVYVTRHMVAIAEGMIQSGTVFGLMIPSSMNEFLASRHKAHGQIGEKFMILGSGDIGLPLVLACSLAPKSLSDAMIVGLFSCLGLFLTHIIFVNQTVRRPMAALPPIATATIIGYLVSLI